MFILNVDVYRLIDNVHSNTVHSSQLMIILMYYFEHYGVQDAFSQMVENIGGISAKLLEHW